MALLTPLYRVNNDVLRRQKLYQVGRTMALLSPIYEAENCVLRKQKLYQTSPKPIMLRGPRSGLYVGVYGTLFAVGMVSTAFAITEMIGGKKG